MLKVFDVVGLVFREARIMHLAIMLGARSSLLEGAGVVVSRVGN